MNIVTYLWRNEANLHYGKNKFANHGRFGYSWKAISFSKGKLVKDKNGYYLWYLHDDEGDAL